MGPETTPLRLICRWNHGPISRLVCRWTRLSPSLDTSRGAAHARPKIPLRADLLEHAAMIKRSVAIFLALWVGLVLPGEAFAYRIQTAATESAPQGHATQASRHGGHADDAMIEKCGKPAHCPHCSTTDKCPKACVVLCAIGMTLSLAANTQPPYNIPAAHLPWTFVPPDTSPPHTSRLLRPPIA